MAGLSPSPSFLPQSGHLSSCDCPSNAFKWVKTSTSASAPWDTEDTVLQRRTTTAEMAVAESTKSFMRCMKQKHKNISLIEVKSKTLIRVLKLLSTAVLRPKIIVQLQKLWLILVNTLTTETFHSSLTQTH